MDNSQPKPLKKFCHVNVVLNSDGMEILESLYNAGWELFAPPAWDSSSQVWRVLLYRDDTAPVPVQPDPLPKTTIIAEATPTVVIPPVVIETPPAPVTEQPTTTDGAGESTDETPLEEDTPTPIVTNHHQVIVVTPNPFPATSFEDEMRRIKADNTLSPMEKTEALKNAGDTIAVEKARKAGQLAWDAWNTLYPVSANFRLLPEEVKS